MERKPRIESIFSKLQAQLRNAQFGSDYDNNFEWAHESIEKLSREIDLTSLLSLFDMLSQIEAPRSRINAQGSLEIWPADQHIGMLCIQIEDGLTLAKDPMSAQFAIEYAMRQLPLEIPESPRDLKPLWKHVRTARIAFKLASTQEFEDLIAAIERYSKSELANIVLSCLIQELVLRGFPCHESPIINEFWSDLDQRDPELCWLPLSTSKAESGLPFPRFTFGFMSFGRGAPSCFDEEAELIPERQQLSFELLEDEEKEKLIIQSCVQPWIDESNAGVIAQSVKCDLSKLKNFGIEDVALSIACTLLGDDAFDDCPFSACCEVGFDDAFRWIFSNAQSSGAYSMKRFGAFGRLGAWQSIRGLLGMFDADWHEVEQVARESKWVLLKDVYFSHHLHVLAFQKTGRIGVLLAYDSA